MEESINIAGPLPFFPPEVAIGYVSFSSNEYFYSIIQPAELISDINSTNKISKDSPFGFGQHKLPKGLENVKETDNPIIAVYTYKRPLTKALVDIDEFFKTLSEKNTKK